MMTLFSFRLHRVIIGLRAVYFDRPMKKPLSLFITFEIFVWSGINFTGSALFEINTRAAALISQNSNRQEKEAGRVL
jgi:hypothetical protein